MKTLNKNVKNEILEMSFNNKVISKKEKKNTDKTNLYVFLLIGLAYLVAFTLFSNVA